MCDGAIAERNRHVVPPADLPHALYTVNDDAVEGHPLVKLDGRKRVCQMCHSHGRKTQMGRSVETTFGCLTCKVNLCKDGPCFIEHHA